VSVPLAQLRAVKVIHATQDVDVLVDMDDADEIEKALTGLGYCCLRRSTTT
jgi:hypothetical protein